MQVCGNVMSRQWSRAVYNRLVRPELKVASFKLSVMKVLLRMQCADVIKKECTLSYWSRWWTCINKKSRKCREHVTCKQRFWTEYKHWFWAGVNGWAPEIECHGIFRNDAMDWQNPGRTCTELFQQLANKDKQEQRR